MRSVGFQFAEKLTQDFCREIELAPNMNVAMESLSYSVGLLGFHRVCYSYMPTTRTVDGRWAPPPVLTRNYPKRWDADWGRHCANDPYYHACFQSKPIVDWKEIQGCEALSPSERDSWNYLADRELSNGVTIPIHLPGRQFAFVSALDGQAGGADDSGQGARDALFLMAHYFHHVTFNKFRNPFPGRKPADLSAREVECPTWAARGKTAEDIACILGRSVETVRAHLKHSTLKLAAINRAHAVAKACHLGLIDYAD